MAIGNAGELFRASIVDDILTCQRSKDYKSCPGGFIESPAFNAWPTTTATRSLKQAATESKCALPVDNQRWLDADKDGYTNFEEWLHAMATYVEKVQKCGSS